VKKSLESPSIIFARGNLPSYSWLDTTEQLKQ